MSECAPPEVVNAATYIQQWMERHRAETHWELMGICSRNHADELRNLKEDIQKFIDKVSEL